MTSGNIVTIVLVGVLGWLVGVLLVLWLFGAPAHAHFTDGRLIHPNAHWDRERHREHQGGNGRWYHGQWQRECLPSRPLEPFWCYGDGGRDY